MLVGGIVKKWAKKSHEVLVTLKVRRLCAQALQAVDHVNEQGMVWRDVLYRRLQGCLKERDLGGGREVHSLIVASGMEGNSFLGSHLIRMYAACGSLAEASEVFEKLPCLDVYAWASIISGFGNQGGAEQALKLYYRMRESSVQPNEYVFVAALKACGSMTALAAGKLIHAHAVETGCECNVFVGNTLIDMYVKCGSLEDARRVFDELRGRDLVSWTAVIAGYAEHGRGSEALQLFQQMVATGLQPDKVMLVSILKACSTDSVQDHGKKVHAYIVEAGLESDLLVGNSLVDMYVKSGSLEDAREVFDRLLWKDGVTWSTMLAGYALQGHGVTALELYEAMHREGVQPNKVALDASQRCYAVECHSCCNAEEGSNEDVIQFFGQMQDEGIQPDKDMSSKEKVKWRYTSFTVCYGRACSLTGPLSSVHGYALSGEGQKALQLFQQMQQDGVQPDMLIFLGLLSACSHGGLLDEGYLLFRSMSQDFTIATGREHYACMVDMLGRAGYRHEAEDLIKSMPSKAGIVVWTCLLGACQIHDNVELGRHAFERILQLDATNAAAYVLMSNIYAGAGNWGGRKCGVLA